MTFVDGNPANVNALRDISGSSPIEFNKTYHVEWDVGGLQTMFPGWEKSAIQDAQNRATEQATAVGGQAVFTYVNVDTNARKIIVEFYIQQVGAIAYALPAIPIGYVIIAIAAAFIALMLYLSLVKIAEVAPESIGSFLEIPKWIAIGIVAIAGIYGLSLVMGAFRSGKDDDDDD